MEEDVAARLEALERRNRVLEDRALALEEELGTLKYNGLDDLLRGGHGVQYYGGGIMRVDQQGLQIATQSILASLFFVSEIVPNPRIEDVVAALKGFVVGTQSQITAFAESHVGNNAYVEVNSNASVSGATYDNYVTIATSGGGLQLRYRDTPANNKFFFVGPVDFQLPTGTSDFTNAEDGMIKYRTDTDKFRVRANGVTRNLATEEGTHRSSSITYISGTGTAGADNTAQTVKTLVLPANTLTQVGDRMRVRAYWRGDTGAAIVGNVLVGPAAAEVTVSHTTDGGAASLFVNEVYLHYIDNTHANIIETENGALGALSAANAAGFDWDSAQNILFTQSSAVNNHTVLFALIVDILPLGIL